MTTRIKRGNGLNHNMHVKNADGTSVNLLSSTITSKLAPDPGGVGSQTLVVTSVNLSGGQFRVDISESIIGALIPGQIYYYDAKIIHPDFTMNTETHRLIVDPVVTA